jgi:hypothetical protein
LADARCVGIGWSQTKSSHLIGRCWVWLYWLIINQILSPDSPLLGVGIHITNQILSTDWPLLVLANHNPNPLN